MVADAGGDARRLKSALLLLSRRPAVLAALLRLLLPPADLAALLRSGGRRKAGALDPAVALAQALGQNSRLLRGTARNLAEKLTPLAGAAPPEEALAEETLPWLRPEALRAVLARDLLGAGEENWQRAAARAESWSAHLPPLADPAPPPARPAAPTRTERPAPARAPRRELAGLKEQLAEERREVARLQDELGRQRQRAGQLQEERDELREQLREARARRSSMKKKLARATAASDREAALEQELEECRRRCHVLEQKLAILEEERDDLHAVLQDHDRFLEVVEEEVPSFRNRPLTAAEQDLAAALAERARAGRPPLRILVVGGGEPQLRHRDKFEEYAEVLGFQGEWRMAEYTAWHKAMRSLQADMEQRFDALVILHWNRTTFTRKAREICNRAGQKPCITCHYEGFISLRQTLQEALRQLLAAGA